MSKSSIITSILLSLAALRALMGALESQVVARVNPPVISEADSAASESDKQGATPFDWLEGQWVGEGFGGVAEEVWSTSRAGVMTGMFRLFVEEKLVFYELFTIRQEGGTKEDPNWVMRLRHFHADLRGWEDKDKPLVWESTLIAEDAAGFGPVLYERFGDKELRASVEVAEGEGTSTETIVFKRVK